jgi:hypothetical protein
MKRVLWLSVLVAMLSTEGRLGVQGASQSPITRSSDIQKGTVIASIRLRHKLKKRVPTGLKPSVISDSLLRDKQPLSRSGIDLQELYVCSFRLHLGEKTIAFHPKNSGRR